MPSTGIKDYIIKNLPHKLSYVFKGSKPFFKKEKEEEVLSFENIPSFLIIPKTTLDEIYSKWEEYKFDMERTTDWLAEKVLTKLTCEPKESSEIGKVIVLMGHTGCGKSSLKDLLIQNNIADGIVTYTTRVPRKEESALDYHFIKNDDFEEKAHNDFFLETSTVVRREEVIEDGEATNEIKVVYFGSAKRDYKGENLKVVVLDAKGYLSIKDKVPCIPIYVEASKDTCINRCLKRGDNLENIKKRLEVDDFKPLEDEKIISISSEEDIAVVYDNLLKIVNKEVFNIDNNRNMAT